MGYDIETGAVGDELSRIGKHPFKELTEIDTLQDSLRIIEDNHNQRGLPATLFVCGRTLVFGLRALRSAARNPLFDIQQHTYSHVLFKEDRWLGTVFPAAPVQALQHEVSVTSALLKKHLGVECIGLRAPHGHDLGLSDRPEYLAFLQECGIRFISSWGRNASGRNPTPLQIQPFWYEEQGYADILEIPFQFWLDTTWFEVHGPENGEGYLSVLKSAVDEIVREDLVYGVCFHDHAMLRYREPHTGWVSGFLDYALSRGVRIMDYAQYYRERCESHRR